MVAWVANALTTATGAQVAGLAVGVEDRAPVWVMAATSARDLSILGDPRTVPELVPLLKDEAGTVHNERLHRVLGVDSLALAAIPLGDGGVHGVAVLGWLPGQVPSPGAFSTMVALLAHLGVALDNLDAMAELEAVQRGVVHKLQEAVRPPTPTVPQSELGVYYLAADQQSSTGGDLYDWVLLPDGDLHLAVVDVMGKGVAATKDAVAVTHALRLLVLDGCPLERVISRADALVTAQNPDLVATLIVGRYDPRTGVLLLAGGGHPPVLVVSDHQVRQVSVGGVPIGFPGAGSDEVVTIVLGRSDTVIFYTDGLIEATKDIIKGLESIARHAREIAGYPAVSLARALVDRTLSGAVRRDDSLALVLRRRSPPVDSVRLPLSPFEYRFTPTTAAIPLARHFLEDWLVRVPVARDEAGDLMLVASELAANAVRHASGQRGSVSLRAWVDGPDLVLEVEDDGGNQPPLPDRSGETPDPLAERGRGLFLVRALVDELHSDVVEGRTITRVVRRAIVADAPV